MSVLDDLNSFFVTGDTFYPGNKNRVARINDLNNDVNDFVALYKTEAKNSRALMEEINAKISLFNEDELPKELKFAPPEQIKETPYESMMNIYSTLCMNPAIQVVWQTARALIHHQSLKELCKDLAITIGTTFAVEAGCILFGGIAGLLVIGPINGAHRRSNLREAIKEGVQCRKTLYRQYYVMTLFDQHLQSVNVALSAFEDVSVLQNIIEQKLRAFNESLSDETTVDNKVNKYLEEHDKSKNSWTKED